MLRMNSSVVMCLFSTVAIWTGVGCSDALKSRVVDLGGKVKLGDGHVIKVDLSRGEYVPTQGDPKSGGVGPREPYLLEVHRPKAIDDHRVMQIPLSATIRDIDLAGCDIGTRTIKYIVESCPNLVSLNLSDTQISNSDLQILSRLVELQHLSLAGTQIDGRGVDHLMLLRQLRELNVVDTNLDGKALELLLELPLLQRIFVFQTVASSENSPTSKKALSDGRVSTNNPFRALGI